jgi:DNA topoisomerase-2
MAVQTNVNDFFMNDVPAYGAYDNCRKLCSYIDGQKISMRKIIYTLMKKYPGKDKIKTETVANVCAAFTNYLHGAGNIGGVCDTMAQNFVGANNYPLIDGNSGGFGTRINPTCAANRYTKIALSSLLKTLINSNDEEIVGRQFFEGDYIEPQFFVPIFPMVFLNGSHGLSTGFSQDIYPRNPIEIIEYIRKKIAGTEHPRMSLLPWFRGHTGKVEYNAEIDRNESFGVIVRNNTTSYTITELPIGVEYQKYVEFLDKLCENNTIQDYDDKCDPKTDKILFDIKTTREFTRKHDGRKLYETLHLIKSLPETLCCIDENNRVREFSSVYEILDAFIEIRLRYYDLRKKYILNTLSNTVEKLNSKYLFVKAIIDKKIVVANKKKDEIIAQIRALNKLVEIDGSYDYLLKMPIYSLSVEVLEELKKSIDDTTSEYNVVKNTTIQDMWITDLKELKKVL